MSLPNLPPFANDISLCFSQLEALYGAYDIPPEHQLSVLYFGLPPSVRDLITSSDPEATYTSVKAEVLRRNQRSSQIRFMTLMKEEHLGDRSPSEFLRQLRELSDSSVDYSPLLKKIFFSHLPQHVQTIFATGLEVNPVDFIALMADKILEFSSGLAIPKPTPEVLVISVKDSRQDAQ